MTATATVERQKATVSPQKRAYDDRKKAKALSTALMRLPDEWVLCRDMRHSWVIKEDFHVAHSSKGVDEIRRDLVCTRCMTIRHEIYKHTRYGLDKLRQGYTYPEDYQLKGVPRGVKPSSIIHQEQYRRAMERVAASARG